MIQKSKSHILSSTLFKHAATHQECDTDAVAVSASLGRRWLCNGV